MRGSEGIETVKAVKQEYSASVQENEENELMPQRSMKPRDTPSYRNVNSRTYASLVYLFIYLFASKKLVVLLTG